MSESTIYPFSLFRRKQAAATDPAARAAALRQMAPKARRRAVHREPLNRAAAVLTLLLDCAHEELDRSAAEALALAALVVETLERAPSGVVYEPLLRARAYKEHAHALRLSGSLPKALETIRTAASAFGDEPAYAAERAKVTLVEALILQDLAEYTAAHVCVAAAKGVFEASGDVLGQNMALQISAYIHYEQHQYRRAEDGFRRALELAEKHGDGAGSARAMNNLAACSAKLERFDAAASWYERAVEAFVALGMTGEVERANAARANMLARQQRTDEALEAFAATRAALLGRGMHLDAADAGLQWVELLVKNGRLEEAAPLCAELLEMFTEAGMVKHALRALACMQPELPEDAMEGELSEAIIRRALEGPVIDRDEFIRDVAESVGLPEAEVRRHMTMLTSAADSERAAAALRRMLEVWQQTSASVLVETSKYRETRDRIINMPGVRVAVPILLERLRRDPYAQDYSNGDSPLRIIRGVAEGGAPPLRLFYTIDDDERVRLLQLDLWTES
ncbi:MAG TPA: tetratricopeptide repeat protein [Thermoanaerobaculia bacterium]